MNDNFIAWIAGFFDGEGCISFLKPNGEVRVSIVQAVEHREVLEEIRREFGGYIQVRPPNPPGKKPIAALHIARQDAVVRFLTAMIPHLRIKRTKAIEAVARIGAPKNRGTASREKALARTHCGNGHALTPDNLTPVKGASRGRCRACARDHMRNHRAKSGK